MIKNETEYDYSQECARRFKSSIKALDRAEELKKKEPEAWQLSRDVKQYHLLALQEEIDEYERLIVCKKEGSIDIKVESINKLPDALIKARIAAKMTQKELADILDIDEERVKEYEKTDYQCASFVEILEVSTVLGVEFATAVVRVDFGEIEEMKKIAARWQNKKLSQAAKS